MSDRGSFQFFIAALVALGTLVAVAPARAQPFENLQFQLCDGLDLPYGDGPGNQEFVLADVTKDGRADVVAINRNDGGVYVIITEGRCRFAEERFFGIEGGLPTTVAVADFNADGNQDFVVADEEDETVTVFLGAGDGTQGEFDIGPGDPPDLADVPIAIGVADFDRNGRPDLAVLDVSGTVSLLRNAGDGSFDFFDQDEISTGRGEAVDLAVGDFNGDNRADIAVLNRDETLAVFLQLSNGQFPQAPGTILLSPPNDGRSVDIVAGNLNGAPPDDLLVVQSGIFFEDNIEIYTGGPRGLSASGVVDLVENSRCAAIGDFDIDGINDLVVPFTESNGGTAISFGLGGGSFSSAAVPLGANRTGRGVAVAVGFVDEDALLDFAILNDGGNRIRVAINTADQPTPTPDPRTPSPTVTGPQPPTEAISPTPTPTRPTNTPTATVTPTPIPTAPFGTCIIPMPAGGRPVAVAAGDFDSNTDADIAVADAANRRVVVFLINRFGVQRPLCDSSQIVAATRSVSLAGVPADLAADQLTGSAALDIAVGGSNGVTILTGDGGGNFTVGTPLLSATDVSLVLTANVDSNGTKDIVAASRTGNSVSVLFGNANGTFQPPVTVAAGQQPVGVAAVDLNGDLLLDLVVASRGAQTINFFLQRNGTFPDALSPEPLGGRPSGLAATDVDGDGTIDLLVTLDETNEMLFLRGVRSGNNLTFVRQPSRPTGTTPMAVDFATFDSSVATDFNMDGRTDIVVANSGSDTLSFFFGGNGGSFTSLVPLAVGNKPVDVAVADFDFDRRKDVVTANEDDGTITLLRSSQPPPTPTPPPTFTPTITDTPGPTGTFTATGTITPIPPSSTGTVTLTPTRTPRPDNTHTPTETPSPKFGAFGLEGSCTVAPPAGKDGLGLLEVLAPALALFWWRRRPVSPVPDDRCR